MSYIFIIINYIFIIIIFLPTFTKAQNKVRPLTGKVLYSAHIPNISLSKSVDTLKFNREKSLFHFQVYNAINKKKKKTKDRNPFISKEYLKVKTDNIGRVNLYDIKKDSLYSRRFMFNQAYLLKAKKPDINWKIADSTKKIGKFTCTKATAYFRGRDYIAWFTTEIPLPYGPWKLIGLPGLILQVHDKNNSISFKAQKVILKNIGSVGDMPLNGKEKVINLAQYKKLIINFKKKALENAHKVARKIRQKYHVPHAKVKFIKTNLNSKQMEIFTDSSN